MWKSARISLPDYRQPNNKIINLIRDFADKWNAKNKTAILERDFGGWDLFLEKETFHFYHTAVNELTELKKEHGIYFTYRYKNHYEEEDYLEADFTQFSSNEIISDTPFVINKKEILPVGGHCSKCNAWHPLTHPKPTPTIIIDESLLKNPMEELIKPDNEAWDIVYDSTYILISGRFKQILEKNNIKGYTLRPVISHSTGEASKKMYQLLANKSIITSALPEGETVQPFCDTCGTAHTPYEFDFAVKKEFIGEDDFFARNPYKGTRLHMSNRVFKLVRQHQLTGLWPQATVAVV